MKPRKMKVEAAGAASKSDRTARRGILGAQGGARVPRARWTLSRVLKAGEAAGDLVGLARFLCSAVARPCLFSFAVEVLWEAIVRRKET